MKNKKPGKGIIEITSYGKVGDAKKGWGYCAIYCGDTRNAGFNLITYSNRIEFFDGFLKLSEENYNKEWKLFGLGSLDDPEKADRKAYENAKVSLVKKVENSGTPYGIEIKVIDRTKWAKQSKQIEIDFLNKND
jgi:hypothetical protein